ncbi:MAG TPA: NADH-quinone oxidoreductase subunit NuoE [Stellaceae bacterium]|jgi:NADH-quinone oxidoreductase subunit E|nr:NADH-quinone oxidoreductase subunit NuoE [Stellaceae bacterium]
MSTADRLSSALRAEIEDLASHAEYRRAASVEALLAVQRRHGWVSDQHLAEVAAILGMSPAELDGVATFFNLIFRRPVGRHVILLCDSVSCWVMGCEVAREHLKRRLGIRPGETTADGRFTLLPIVCLGHCDHAPAMMVDEDLHGDLDPARLDAALGKYR